MKKSTTVWKGYISFGLVSIDIELYTAVQEHIFGFQLLHATCKSSINYERKCSSCNKKVEWSSVVKGLKLNNGNYFIVTKEYLAQLRYIAKVGTGFSFETLQNIEDKFAKISTNVTPVVNYDPKFKDIHWLKPRLVAEIAFREFTPQHYLRQSVFKRLRTDKNVQECTFKYQIS